MIDAAELTLPADGGAATRQLIGRFVKKLARDLLELPPAAWGPDVSGAVGELLARLRSLPKPAVLRLLRRPQVHAPLEVARGDIEAGRGGLAKARLRQLAVQLAYEMALDGVLARPWRWPAEPPMARVSSPTHRAAMALADGAAIDPAGDLGRGASSFEPVDGAVVLSLLDANPISDFEAHPDKQGNQLDLGDADAAAWVTSLQDSLALVGRHLPALRAEMGLVLQQFVPVGTDRDKHLSASYRESVGTVYLTLHPRLMTMAEAVIHEYQHNKVNMLFHLDPVMHNAFHPLYRSPVRPDPRPLHGVLLAAHAFVPVAELYRRMEIAGDDEARRGGFHQRMEAIVGKNAEALDTLQRHAEPTPVGRALLDGMLALHGAHRAYLEAAA